MDTSKLKAVINAEPLNAGRTDAEILAWLKESVDFHKRVPKADLEEYFLDKDIYHLIMEQTAGEAGKIAHKIRLLFASRRDDVDITRPPVAQGLAALKAAGLLDDAQVAEIRTMGTETEVRFTHHGFPDIDDASWLAHLAEARAL